MFVNAIAYNQPKLTSCTIASGTAITDSVALPPGTVLVGIQMPTAWTAAGITLQGSADNVTFQNVYIAAGTELALTVAASTTVALDPALYHAFAYLKVRSGTAATPVNQAADRTVGLITKPL